MPLMIDAPQVEDRLKKAAAKKGVKPTDLAVEILSSQLEPEEVPARGEPRPFYETATPEQWVAEFDRWVESHPKRQPLPVNAFDRLTFYEGRS